MNAMLARLIAGQVCLHACMTGLRMAAPLLALHQGYSPAAVGVLLALFALTQVLFAMPAGRYVDRHGLKRPVAIAVVLAVAGAALAAAFPVFWVLCLAALMSGGAAGAAVIALQRHVGRSANDATELKQVFSWLAVGPSLSNFIGPFAAGLLIDYAGSQPGDLWGYRVSFAFLAVLALACWFWVRRVPELPPVVRPSGASGGDGWAMLREPMMRRLLLVNWMLASCWDVHTFMLPMLGHERGLSASVIGAILGAFAIATAVVRLAMPLLAARLREGVVIAWAMGISAALFGIYPLLQQPLAMGLVSVLLGLALGSVQPMIMSTLHQITPEHLHGQALGLRMVAINGASVLMPLMFGSAGALVGVAGVFWIVGASVSVCARSALKLSAGVSPGAPRSSAPKRSEHE